MSAGEQWGNCALCNRCIFAMKAPRERKKLRRWQCRKYEKRSTPPLIFANMISPPLIFAEGVDSTSDICPRCWLHSCKTCTKPPDLRWYARMMLVPIVEPVSENFRHRVTHSLTLSSPDPQLAAYSSQRRAWSLSSLSEHPYCSQYTNSRTVRWTQICPNLARNWQLSFSLRSSFPQSNQYKLKVEEAIRGIQTIQAFLAILPLQAILCLQAILRLQALLATPAIILIQAILDMKG